jgi:hypothetical protein
MELLLGWLGLTATIASLVVTGVTLARQRRMEQLLRTELTALAANVLLMTETAHWSDQHTQAARTAALELPESQEKRRILEEVGAGRGDSLSTARSALSLMNQVNSIRVGVFKDAPLRHRDFGPFEPEALPAPKSR